MAEPSQAELAEQLYGQLQQAGVDALLDDRSERAGVKFKDADLVGIPWRVVVGRGAGEGLVELVERATGEKRDLSAPSLLTTLLPVLQQQRNGI
jgi:prolyl-tRNA synthetase